MHFHLPKPLHGWREFAGEVGIIVIGVLIALGAEQFVERLRWERELSETRQSLNAELGDAREAARERVLFRPCLKRQLVQLDALTEQKLVPTGLQPWRLNVGLRPWQTSSWEAATASGVLAHMSQEERDRYSALYGLIKPIGALHLQAFEVSTDLNTLAEHPRLTDVSRDRVQAEIARLRGINGMMALGSQQLLDHSASLHIGLTPNQRSDLEQVRGDVRACHMPIDSAQTVAKPHPQ